MQKILIIFLVLFLFIDLLFGFIIFSAGLSVFQTPLVAVVVIGGLLYYFKVGDNKTTWPEKVLKAVSILAILVFVFGLIYIVLILMIIRYLLPLLF